MKRIITCTAVLLLLTTGAAHGQESVVEGPFDPVEALRPTGGPLVVVRPQREAPVVAIRVAVRVEEPPEAAGVVRTLQTLARTRMKAAAALHGARADVDRTATHALYTVVGPPDGFERYVELLKDALSAPEVTPGRLNTLRIQAEAEALAHLDTPEPLLRWRLRSLVFPTMMSQAEADAPARLTPESLVRASSRLFRPERIQVVVAGAVSSEAAAAAFRDWPRGEGPLPSQADARAIISATPEPEPQVLFPWVALGYAADEEMDAAALAVAARLIEDRLKESFLRSARAALWWLPGDRRALVLIGSASPREARAFYGSVMAPSDGADGSGAEEDGESDFSIPADAAAASPEAIASRLRGTVSRAAALLTPAEVARVRRAVRRDILFAARTPDGMATVLGEFLQRTGDAQSANRFLLTLDRVDAVDVHDILTRLAGRTPVSTELTP